MPPSPLGRPKVGIAKRLTLVFASLLLIFGTGSTYAVQGLLKIHEALHQVEHDAAKARAVLELSGAVRDQYAHVAHTVIIGNDSHVARYTGAAAEVGRLAAALRRQIAGREEEALVDGIERASREIDGVFRERLLPAVRAGSRQEIGPLHDRVLGLVGIAEQRAGRLTRLGEATIAGFGQHASAVQHGVVRWTLVFLVAAIACAAGVGVYLYRSIARPVAALGAGAARLAAGDLDTRIDVPSRDELGRLAEQFNGMIAALKHHQRRLVQSEKFASAGRLAAGVAHEINNPLGVILGYVKLLRRKADERLDADLKIVEDEANRCREVVEDLLDLGRTPAIETDTVRLGELCAEVIERVKAVTPVPRPRIEMRGDETVLGSRRRLRQVLLNLVKNAVEAAGPEGRVTIDVGREGDRGVELTVQDSGPGVRTQDQQYLFEPFFTTKPSGTGLGLAVSRAIARAHGGDLVLEPPGQGGAVFKLRLPDEQRRAA